jgi:hypothetical protein
MVLRPQFQPYHYHAHFALVTVWEEKAEKSFRHEHCEGLAGEGENPKTPPRGNGIIVKWRVKKEGLVARTVKLLSFGFLCPKGRNKYE